MIRFSYDSPEDASMPFQHFSLEGDNKRGYVLLGWNDDARGEEMPAELADMMLQQWFETLGEALDFCNGEFCIMRTDWHAPTVKPPVSDFTRPDRRKGESTLLNPNPKPLSET